MSFAESKAASVTPPVQGENLWRFTLGTVEYIEIPAAWRGAYLTFKAVGGDANFAFSKSSTGNASSSSSEVSTVASNVVSDINVNNLATLADGERADFDMAATDPHTLKTFIFGGTGTLEVVRSSGPVR